MCGTCGCSDPKNETSMIDPATGEKIALRAAGANGALNGNGQARPRHRHDDHRHDHHHRHDHGHDHDDAPHAHGPNGEIISLEQAVLAKNDAIAARNRGWFEGRGVLALNLVSAPGAGKTTLLERTVRALRDATPVHVIEGDQMTSNDAERIRKAGAAAIQINTGAGCHLEADMVARAVERLAPKAGSVLFIENVGNLVCPAMFDLGEAMKVVVISTTEGEDKPLKYPHMFRAAGLVLINKIDLAPHVDFDEAQCRANIAEINPDADVLALSAKTGAGLEAWFDFLRNEMRSARPA